VAAATTLSNAPVTDATMIQARVDIGIQKGKRAEQYSGAVKPAAQSSIQISAAILPDTLSRRWEKKRAGSE
jgi:hypothetical protein